MRDLVSILVNIMKHDGSLRLMQRSNEEHYDVHSAELNDIFEPLNASVAPGAIGPPPLTRICSLEPWIFPHPIVRYTEINLTPTHKRAGDTGM